MHPELAQFIAFLESSKYVLLGVGSFVEGSVVMMTGGFLWRLGEVSFFPAYFSLMAGDFLSDMMWYWIGYFGARRLILRWGHLLEVTPLVVEKVERRFHKHHTWILGISKLSMGFGTGVATLLVAGMLRIPLWRFVVINLLGGIFWIAFLMVIGYYFGNVYALIPSGLNVVFAILVLGGFILLVRYISRKLATADW